MISIKEDCINFIHKNLGEDFEIETIQDSGSNRGNYRIKKEGKSLILTHGENIEENQYFFHLQKIFSSENIAVPKLLFISQDLRQYIQEDLGVMSLYKHIQTQGIEKSLPLLIQAIKVLISIQINTKAKINYNLAHEFSSFSPLVAYNDLFYFKNFFLDLLDIPYSKKGFIDDIKKIGDSIAYFDEAVFLYRDFQSRNLVVSQDKVYCIDFQGGMKGFFGYDLASLIWQSRIDLPIEIKEQLKQIYFSTLIEHIKIPHEDLQMRYEISILLRCLQTLGAYGLRGIIEGKETFLSPIEKGLVNLKTISRLNLLDNFTHIQSIVSHIDIPLVMKKIKSR
jgi:aminoglycoside/choline kinase family phosphotransferase